MVGSAGTRQPAESRSQACRGACPALSPAHDAGVHLRPRLGPANSLSELGWALTADYAVDLRIQPEHGRLSRHPPARRAPALTGRPAAARGKIRLHTKISSAGYSKFTRTRPRC
jgi:hypothetical protein